MPVEIPAEFLQVGSRGPDWAAWLDGLPRLTRELLDDWDLRVDGASAYGNCALVVPVLAKDGTAAVLKVQFPHAEAETEHLALRIWDGNGAIRLLRADPRRFAMLLERAAFAGPDQRGRHRGLRDRCLASTNGCMYRRVRSSDRCRAR